MPTCKNCGRRGFLQKVTWNGLCDQCDPVVTMVIRHRHRIIDESISVIRNANNADIVESRFRLLMDQVEILYEYELKDITTIDPPPSAYMKASRREWENYIAQALDREFQDLADKVHTTPQKRVRISLMNDYQQRYFNYRSRFRNQSLLEDLGKKLEALLLG